MSSLLGHELDGVRFAVFGCGNHEWRKTYQRVPRLCDELLEKRGGRRLIDRGEGDAADGTIFDVFDQFKTSLWEVLSKVSIIGVLLLSSDLVYCRSIML